LRAPRREEFCQQRAKKMQLGFESKE